MDIFTITGIGLSVGVALVRVLIFKKSATGGKGKKLRYYNYRKYIVKHKNTSQALNLNSGHNSKKGF